MKSFKFGLVLISIIFGLNLFIPMIYASNGIPIEKPINAYQYSEKINTETAIRYQFRERTSLQYWGNVTTLIDLDVDSEEIGEQNISVEYHAENQVELQIRLNATNEGMELTHRNRLRIRNGSEYESFEYKYLLICNLSRNTTDTMVTTLRLHIEEQDRNSTWAWYNEESGEFECLQSYYENGEIIANTTHYSSFVLFTGLDSDIIGDDWWLLILGIVTVFTMVSLLIIQIYLNQKKT